MRAHVSSCNPRIRATLKITSLPGPVRCLSGCIELKTGHDAAFIKFNLVTFLHIKLTQGTSFIPNDKVNFTQFINFRITKYNFLSESLKRRYIKVSPYRNCGEDEDVEKICAKSHFVNM